MTTEPTIWQRLSGMLGIREDQAEDALHSERAANLVLSRRSFFGVSGALIAGTAFAFPTPAKDEARRLTAGEAGMFLRADGTWQRAQSLTSFDRLLKERYSDGVRNLVWSDDPYLKAIKIVGRGALT